MSRPDPLPPSEPPGEPGARFLGEIREQPQALRRLLEEEEEIARVAGAMRKRGATLVRLVGHGSSDNAASFGVYAFGLLPRWTALRDSISLTVHYRSLLDMAGSTVIGLSQSGRTPDVVEYVAQARSRGAFTVAVTNHPGSDLARVAEAVVPLAAGPEQAVAASKTYLSELAALALLAGHAAGQGSRLDAGVLAVADRLEELLPDLERAVRPVALAFSFIGRMVVVGRGPELATAREVALKLLETCRVAAEPLTATDLAHGPVAALDPLFPVWAIVADDPTLASVVDALARARRAGATIVATGTAAASVEGAAYLLPIPAVDPPLLSPLLSVIPGQLFAWALARAKGLDPDQPPGLTKVTLAP